MDILATNLKIDLSSLGYGIKTDIESLVLDKADLKWLFKAVDDGIITKGDIDVTVYYRRKEIDNILFSIRRGTIDLKTPDPTFTPLPVRDGDEEIFCRGDGYSEKLYR